jgi:hypothetical protein
MVCGVLAWVAAGIVEGTSMLSIVIHVLYGVAFSKPIKVTLCEEARRYTQAMLGAFFAFADFKLLTSRC